LRIIRTKQFKKDVKNAKLANKNTDLLAKVMRYLVKNKPLDRKHKDHKLRGNYQGCRECHISPDFLLVYVRRKEEIVFVRIGSHSELFN